MARHIIIAASLAVAAAIITAAVMSFTNQEGANNTTEEKGQKFDYEIRKITINGIPLVVEIADDGPETAQGLMFRNSLQDDRGMLFIFEKEYEYTFWMMNMRFNIDIIWLNASGRVVHIVQDAEPCTDTTNTSACTFTPDQPAKYVLEVNAGFVRKHGIDENSIMILT